MKGVTDISDLNSRNSFIQSIIPIGESPLRRQPNPRMNEFLKEAQRTQKSFHVQLARHHCCLDLAE